MRNFIRKGWISAALVVLSAMILLNVSGCSVTPSYAMDLMEGITADGTVTFKELKAESILKASDFALKLFKACRENGQNTLVSPLSVIAALSMTANGAGGETLSQMESMFGMDIDELNAFTGSYLKSFTGGDKCKVNIADSIWFDDSKGFVPEKDFLQTNANYYDASLYKAPFNDDTVKELNAWVNKNTDHTIPEIIAKLPQNSIMVILNALAFEAEWLDVYNTQNVREGTFTCEDGSQKTAEFMYGKESLFLKDDKATGFIKRYSGGKYAFAAMLPDEGVTISEYVAYLNGENIQKTLAGRENCTVYTSIPKFEAECSFDLKDRLISLGMKDAFDQNNADFSRIGSSTNGNIYVNGVVHKTYIKVDEKGTKAGAATAVIFGENSADLDFKEVYLDRPFVYMLIDLETNIPFFIGVMSDTESSVTSH